jgi:hypothetical protein
MSTRPAVTMQDLELEQAELLPSRETLCCAHPKSGGSSSTLIQNGYGNTAQAGGLNIAVANGSFDNILSFGSGNVLGL